MARETVAEEVRVLRFFETGSIEKVEAVLNIAVEKVRERLQGARRPDAGGSRRNADAGRRRVAKAKAQDAALNPAAGRSGIADEDPVV